jgi:hypothetical protein
MSGFYEDQRNNYILKEYSAVHLILENLINSILSIQNFLLKQSVFITYEKLIFFYPKY